MTTAARIKETLLELLAALDVYSVTVMMSDMEACRLEKEGPESSQGGSRRQRHSGAGLSS